MDNGHELDAAKVVSSIREHDVISMRFVIVGKRLLLDFRSNELDGPMVRLAEPAKSARERFAMLARMRPRFPPPEKFVSIRWPRFVRSLEELGIREAILTRVAEAGHPDAVRNAERALDALLEAEIATQRDAIVGEGFRTLWSASPSRR
ncbi:MAG: hypothetical protein KC482_03365 [Dehalococcoidia bacterium]|nr:hypothetical protein [Dehalococcoidia bacterium]MCA9825059.1 hypothetical protein [Dehalococcoidia bacterium]MCA9844113.1 hypothetical protein [Dehalococcoidia bacterium]MCA9852625.1 hypothetical protein [Dehalococcoidia bacterium]